MTRLAAAELAGSALADFFGEDAAKVTSAEVCTMLQKFIDAFKAASHKAAKRLRLAEVGAADGAGAGSGYGGAPTGSTGGNGIRGSATGGNARRLSSRGPTARPPRLPGT